MSDEGGKKTELKLELVREIKLPTAVLAGDFANDQHLVAACLDGWIFAVDLETGEQSRLGQHSSYASGVRYLQKTNLVLSSGYDGALQWHDPVEKKTVRRVQAHQFWSWQMDVSPDERLLASVTGQYLPGGYKYEPAAEREPSVKIFDITTGELTRAFSHIPPVLSVAFSPNSQFLAAANMMGEVRVWDLQNGEQVAAWQTPEFTSWGIIKSHHYIGGIFALTFSPDGNEILAAGMGPMNDPMAGNGKQMWQKFAWRENPPKKTLQINENESGNGLMETILFHPDGKSFLMAGRMAQGKWNTALFDASSGEILHSLDSKMRVTDAAFSSEGHEILLSGATSQEKKKDGKCPDFGRIKRYRVVA